ncbi:S ribonuclease [Pyrus ussuriensis x Pyrus communis]|uniref:S ribonuclease n=1 Tax=Pyrus ussuriensis x Pyrus communis TaxID=2448454 RepID=A0A5N5GC52_9ROSA|nr:S ribonuclease [Pyrus ussuriensis x Pyrus communis]
MDWGIMEMEEMEEKWKGNGEKLTAREKMEVFVVCVCPLIFLFIVAQGLRDVVGVLNGLGDYGNGRNGGKMEGKWRETHG